MYLRTLIAASFFAVAGCQPPEEATSTEEKAPARTKTDAELLLGTWQVVEQGNPPVPPKAFMQAEYTKDGKVHFIHDESDNPRPNTQLRLDYTGTYHLEGETLWLTIPPRWPEPGQTNWSTIISLTEDELITLGKPDPTGHREKSVLKRIGGTGK